MAETTRKSGKLNVFIAYSRDDLDFADVVDAALRLGGFETTLDRHGISPGEDWKKRLGVLIRDCDTIAFVTSPSSARSEICAWEAKEAVQLGKRIVPVLARALGDAKPPPELAGLEYIICYREPKRPGSGFGPGLTSLAEALNTDLDWLREHTRYLRLAKEWEEVRKPSDRRLLSAADIALANTWVADRPEKAAPPTALQFEFFRASEAEDIRQKSAEAQRLREAEEAADKLQVLLTACTGFARVSRAPRRTTNVGSASDSSKYW
jgi:hypothetical protein